MLACKGNVTAAEQFHDTSGRAGDEARVVFLRQLAEVEGVETVHVLLGRNAAKHRHLVESLGKWGLHKNTIHAGINVELFHQRFQFRLRDCHGRKNQSAFDTDFRCRGLFLLHVGDRSRIFPDANQRETGPATLDRGDLRSQFGHDDGRNLISVDQFHIQNRLGFFMRRKNRRFREGVCRPLRRGGRESSPPPRPARRGA